MSSIEGNLDALTRAVESEARGEAEHILADAQAKAQTIRQTAQQQADSERAQILEQARQEAARIRSQAIANAQLQTRTAQLERREKLLNAVFAAAQQQLPAMQQRPTYDQIARHLLHAALMQLGANEVRVRTDERTRAVLTDHVLAEVSKELGMQLQIGEPLRAGTGVIVETLDGHRHYDNTLEARLNRRQNTLRYAVYQILMGESR